MKLVKLEKISPKKQWPHEAHDFTPWLAENLQELGEIIGYDLELIGREVPVGPFSADLLVKDINSETKIVIENQLEKTNHDHLGKCITYTSVLDAKVVVWISTKFTDEHKKAMEWLNENTPRVLSFYGIELGLLKVDKDTASVVFDVVVSPNEVVKDSHENIKDISANAQKQLKFWTLFRDAISTSFHQTQTPRAQYWYDVPLGKSGINISNTYNTQTNEIGCRVYISNSIVDKMLPYLESRKDEIEKELGFSMTWNPNPKNRDKVITHTKVFNLESEDGTRDAVEWLKEKTISVHKVFSAVIREYKEIDVH